MRRSKFSIRELSSTLPALLGSWGVLALLAICGFAVAYRFVGAPPPKHLRIAAGSPDGAYYRFATDYARLLADDGITLDVVATAGSVENLERLERGDVSLALVQGGSASASYGGTLQSLGSLFMEPVWVFTRAGAATRRLSELETRRIAAGESGSGTEVVAEQLLAANGVTPATATFVKTNPNESIEALLNGTVDAAMFVASPEAAFVRRLLLSPDIVLTELDRTAAYAGRFTFLTPFTLHEGVIDLERNIPARDTQLVATVASLAARDDLNAGLVPAVLDAVTRVHDERGLPGNGRAFPSTGGSELPMNPDAARYITDGPSFLYRWLPYQTAVLLDRLKVLALPFLALLVPIFRIGPPLYQWRVRSKIYRWYADVRTLDLQTLDDPSTNRDGILRQLSALEREVASVSVPLAYTGELYHLRLHIRLLQERMKAGA